MTNRAVLVGRLTKDPELRFTPNGIAVTTFTLAVNRPFKNANGEQEADFINIVVWKKAAENVANYTSKGSLVAIDGRIQTRSYENKDGQRVYVTEVVADSVQFLGTKKREAQQQNSQQRYTSDPGTPFQGGQPVDISDDDLPF
jgi:single-strand DNA-binding protein